MEFSLGKLEYGPWLWTWCIWSWYEIFDLWSMFMNLMQIYVSIIIGTIFAVKILRKIAKNWWISLDQFLWSTEVNYRQNFKKNFWKVVFSEIINMTLILGTSSQFRRKFFQEKVWLHNSHFNDSFKNWSSMFIQVSL